MTIPVGLRSERIAVSGGSNVATVLRPYSGPVRRAVIFSSGHTGTDSQILDTSAGGAFKAAAAAARAGCPVINTFAGLATMGNNTATTDMLVCHGHAANLGAPTGKVFVMGVSMGFLAAANYARLAGAANIAGIIGLIPGTSLAYIHDSSAPNEAIVDAAYTDHAGYLAARPTRDPSVYGPTDLAGIPMLLCYATDESGATAGLSAVQADFADDMDSVTDLTVHTFTGGHTINNAVGFDHQLIADWLLTHQ